MKLIFFDLVKDCLVTYNYVKSASQIVCGKAMWRLVFSDGTEMLLRVSQNKLVRAEFD